MLFPAIQPFSTRHFSVSDTHSLYVEECGNPEGLAVMFLHGGPGGCCEPLHRRFFDPERYHIILFDQRGSGQSKPHASLEENTSADLIADIEKIRQFLQIEHWVVFGGSWGSTLALIYAQTHPQRVLGLILRGVFLARDEDVQWFYQCGAGRIFPEAWKDFLAPIDEHERDDLVSAYYRRLTSSNEIIRMAAAKAWSLWEGRAATLMPDDRVVHYFRDPRVALSIARIESHYFYHRCFLEPDQLLRNAGKMAQIPGFIVHGRYDMICPVEQALLLDQHWSCGRLRVIEHAGHAVTEAGISAALIDSTQQMLDILT